jgi:hypothetical protein
MIGQFGHVERNRLARPTLVRAHDAANNVGNAERLQLGQAQACGD